MRSHCLTLRLVCLGILLVLPMGAGCGLTAVDVELIHVSYDPTREVFREINSLFAEAYHRDTGRTVRVLQSHGGSGAQTRAVLDGLPADVVSLAVGSDLLALERAGLVKRTESAVEGPFWSTIVFVVRKGNPRGIRDWPDLARPGVQVITPNPKTSGGARWNFLAVWGFVTVHQKQPDAAARDVVRRLFANVVKLDSGARGATDTFLRKQQGDVLIAWENEARLAVAAQGGRFDAEIVYPSASLRADPPLAVVDARVDARGTRPAAEAYVRFLDTPIAQRVFAAHGFRPRQNDRAVTPPFPAIPLFTLAEVAGDWERAEQRFFADGGEFDQLYNQPR